MDLSFKKKLYVIINGQIIYIICLVYGDVIDGILHIYIREIRHNILYSPRNVEIPRSAAYSSNLISQLVAMQPPLLQTAPVSTSLDRHVT